MLYSKSIQWPISLARLATSMYVIVTEISRNSTCALSWRNIPCCNWLLKDRHWDDTAFARDLWSLSMHVHNSSQTIVKWSTGAGFGTPNALINLMEMYTIPILERLALLAHVVPANWSHDLRTALTCCSQQKWTSQHEEESAAPHSIRKGVPSKLMRADLQVAQFYHAFKPNSIFAANWFQPCFRHPFTTRT